MPIFWPESRICESRQKQPGPNQERSPWPAPQRGGSRSPALTLGRFSAGLQPNKQARLPARWKQATWGTAGFLLYVASEEKGNSSRTMQAEALNNCQRGAAYWKLKVLSQVSRQTWAIADRSTAWKRAEGSVRPAAARQNGKDTGPPTARPGPPVGPCPRVGGGN